jgi:hypothetical protein
METEDRQRIKMHQIRANTLKKLKWMLMSQSMTATHSALLKVEWCPPKDVFSWNL